MLFMKRLVAAMAVGSILTAIYPAGAVAQAQKDAPAAAGAPAAEKRAAPRATRGSWTRADARVCLEFPTNLQIIKCAEKYRYTRVPA
jgi:invasion protein IalB